MSLLVWVLLLWAVALVGVLALVIGAHRNAIRSGEEHRSIDPEPGSEPVGADRGAEQGWHTRIQGTLDQVFDATLDQAVDRCVDCGRFRLGAVACECARIGAEHDSSST